MKAAGVGVHEYHPVYWWNFSTYRNIDLRTHRKLLVIDGKIGFTGGVGIADVWRGDAESPQHWRDNHYRIEGPVVARRGRVSGQLDEGHRACVAGRRIFPGTQASRETLRPGF